MDRGDFLRVSLQLKGELVVLDGLRRINARPGYFEGGGGGVSGADFSVPLPVGGGERRTVEEAPVPGGDAVGVEDEPGGGAIVIPPG